MHNSPRVKFPLKTVVEKVGGTSMLKTSALLNSVILRDLNEFDRRVLVVSAFGGVTNILLENKHDQTPGVYSFFQKNWNQKNDNAWQSRLSECANLMHKINANVLQQAQSQLKADQFIDRRLQDVHDCLAYMASLCQFGHFNISDHLDKAKEMLCSIGEAHSAYTTHLLAQEQGIPSRFVDLTGWHDEQSMSLEMRISLSLKEFSQADELLIVTGYCQCQEGLIKTYGRGYTEITLAKLAQLVMAQTVVIHKEFFLSSGDPRYVSGELPPLRHMSYQLANLLAGYGMEAIHPVANTWLTQSRIPLQLKHIEKPEDPGTTLVVADKEGTKGPLIVTGVASAYVVSVVSQELVLNPPLRLSWLSRLIKQVEHPLLGTEFQADRFSLYLLGQHPVQHELDAYKVHCPNAECSFTKVAIIGLLGVGLEAQIHQNQAIKALDGVGIPVLAMQLLGAGREIRILVPRAFYAESIAQLHQTFFQG